MHGCIGWVGWSWVSFKLLSRNRGNLPEPVSSVYSPPPQTSFFHKHLCDSSSMLCLETNTLPQSSNPLRPRWYRLMPPVHLSSLYYSQSPCSFSKQHTRLSSPLAFPKNIQD